MSAPTKFWRWQHARHAIPGFAVGLFLLWYAQGKGGLWAAWGSGFNLASGACLWAMSYMSHTYRNCIDDLLVDLDKFLKTTLRVNTLLTEALEKRGVTQGREEVN